MRSAVFSALVAVVSAIFVVALPVQDLVALDARAPEATVARATSPVDDILNELQTAIAGPIATLSGLTTSDVSSEIIVQESIRIFNAVDEAAHALGDLKNVQDLDKLFGSSGWLNAAKKISGISKDTLSVLAGAEAFILTDIIKSKNAPRESIRKTATGVNDLVSNFLELFNGAIGSLRLSVTSFIANQMVNLQAIVNNISQQVSQAFQGLILQFVQALANFSNGGSG